MRTRQSFDEQLTELHEGLFRIGTMVEQALTQSLYAVKTYDQELAQTIIDGDLLINDEVQRLHNRALLLIATQQPMASDLRLISVVLSLLPELERMGDYAATIAKVQQRIMRAPTYVPLDAMPEPFPGLISEIGRRTSEILHAGWRRCASAITRLPTASCSSMTRSIICMPGCLRPPSMPPTPTPR